MIGVEVRNEQSRPGPPSAPSILSREEQREREKHQLLQRSVDKIQNDLAQIREEKRHVERLMEIEIFRRRALSDLYFFTREVMGFKDLYKPLHGPLCELLQNEGVSRRLILYPRGHFKTTICSVSYPLWLLANDPNRRISLCSKAAHKAEENLEEIVARARRPKFQFLFSKTVGNPDDWPVCRKDKVRIPRTGMTTGPSIAAYGTESSEVGRHFDHMILDDIVDNDNVNSQPVRDGVWQWFGRQLSVLDPASILTVIGTRWHWDDPYSRIQKQLVTYEKNKNVGWYTDKRKAIENGRCIFPTRFTVEELNEIRKVQGDYIFSCFYFNEPAGEDMNPFDLRKMKWISYPKSQPNAWTYILVDPASTKEDYSSYTGIIVGDALATSEQKFVVRRCILEKMHPDETVDRLFALVEQYQARQVIIEDESYQKSLYYWTRREMLYRGRHFQVVPVSNPRNVSQPQRLLALQPFVNGQTVMFANEMPEDEKNYMLEEFETYPKGPHKDLICALYFITRAFFPPERRSKKKEEPPPKRAQLITQLAWRREKNGRIPNLSFGGRRP